MTTAEEQAKQHLAAHTDDALLAAVLRRLIQRQGSDRPFLYGPNYVNIGENEIRLDGIAIISDQEQAALLKTLPETDRGEANDSPRS